MGLLISELRKSHHMTQKELAEKLNVTDKAVSKWERGLSCPDISLLSLIADILGITVNELLCGIKDSVTAVDVGESIDNALQYADKVVKHKSKSMLNIFAATFSALMLLGIITCAICDIAISGAFTWSLIPISSIVFAFLLFLPALKFGNKGIAVSLIVLSVLIIPFIYVLSHLIETDAPFLTIGIRMSMISIVFAWSVFALFKKLRSRKLVASAISVWLTIPVYIIVNFTLNKIIDEQLIDIWDIMSFSIIAVVGIVLFVVDHTMRKKRS